MNYKATTIQFVILLSSNDCLELIESNMVYIISIKIHKTAFISNRFV